MTQDLSNALKEGMRFFASGVGVVTANSPTGERHAMTASSVTSVSDAPPSILVCVNTSARIASAVDNSEYFSVNVLSESHENVSRNCATPSNGDAKFSEGNWVKCDDTGLYYLDDSPAVFICKRAKALTHGTHNIYVGDLTKIIFSDKKEKLLVYANGGYHYI